MMNPRITSSKKQQNKHGSPRSPLKFKNLNITSCSSSFSSSTTTSSISSEVPNGCLRFFLSQNSSIVSNFGSNSRVKCSNVRGGTPKSALDVRNFKKNVVKKGSNLPNPDKFSARDGRLVKKNPPKPNGKFSLSSDSDNVGRLRKPRSRCDFSDGISKKSSEVELKCSNNAANLSKPGSRYDLSDGIGKNSSGFELKCCDNATKLRKPGSRYDLSDGTNENLSGLELKCSDNAENVRKPRSRYDLSDGMSEKSSGFELKCSDNAANLREPGSRYDLSDGMGENSSGFELKRSDKSENAVNLRIPGSRCDISDGIGNNLSGFELKCSDDAANLRKLSSRYDLSDGMSQFSTASEVDRTEDFISANKLEFGSGLVGPKRNNKVVNLVGDDAKCAGHYRSPTPPVQASVSPDIQGGSTSIVASTPSTCYAAGHVLSGVTDKRKCRPKGILTIGNYNLFGSSKTKGFHSEGESFAREMNGRRDSIVPSPTEASVYWLSSSCDEKWSESRADDIDGNTNKLRLTKCEKLLPFKLVGCSSSSSPLSSLGFSSGMLNKSNCTTSTSYTNSATPSSSSGLDSDLSSEFRGVLGPSLDHLVRCPSSPSPIATPIFEAEFSSEHDTFRFDHEKHAIPDLEDSLGSGNVMQTPESTSTPSNYFKSSQALNSNSRSPNFGLSGLSKDQICRLWSECELDSASEALRRVTVSDSPRPSFEFNPHVNLDGSIDLTLSRNAMNTGTLDLLDSPICCIPDPDVRMWWRKESENGSFEMDELDCCRYLSDEDDDSNGCIVVTESCSHPQTAATVSDKISSDGCHPITVPLQSDNTS